MTCVLIWQFTVAPENAEAFERIYAADGDWAQLSAKANGFLGTELLKDAEQPGVYLTIDRWTTPEAFAAFKREFAQAYAALDLACEGLTQSETRIGIYDAH